METESEQTTDEAENWLLLMDPSWRPSAEDEPPPIEAMVGLWPIEDGGIGKFRPNPDYLPADDRSPSDPLDAVLRLVMQGNAESKHIQLMLRSTLMDVAMNGDGRPLITKSPDEILCAVVTTGEVHRARLASPGWRRVDLAELVDLLGDEFHVLFNPGGPAAVRLTGDFLRQSLLLTDDEITDLYTEYANVNELQIIPWDITGGATQDEPSEAGTSAAGSDDATTTR